MVHQIFIQSPNSKTLTLTFHPAQSITLQDLKLSLFPNLRNPSSLYFSFNSKPLHDSTHIPNPRIPNLSTLNLLPRLLGGGGDGGATGAESRDCYLNMYAEKKPDKVDLNEQRLSRWLTCALSNEPLIQPCVIDRLGNIFNKETLVEALLGKKLPKEFGYIKGLKDMINVKLEPIKDGESGGEARYQCPIAGLEFNGTYRFFALRKCGHVLSAKALKEVKSSACLVCYKEFDESDKFPINGSEEEVAVLRERMEGERARVAKDGKKTKKVKNEEVGVAVVNGGESGLDTGRLSGKKHGIVADGKAVDTTVSGKVTGNGKIEKVKDVGAAKRFKAGDMAPPNATKEVYASLFTSSNKSKFKETYSCRSLPLGRN